VELKVKMVAMAVPVEAVGQTIQPVQAELETPQSFLLLKEIMAEQGFRLILITQGVVAEVQLALALMLVQPLLEMVGLEPHQALVVLLCLMRVVVVVVLIPEELLVLVEPAVVGMVEIIQTTMLKAELLTQVVVLVALVITIFLVVAEVPA
jgi:hypothetical protein